MWLYERKDSKWIRQPILHNFALDNRLDFEVPESPISLQWKAKSIFSEEDNFSEDDNKPRVGFFGETMFSTLS